MNVVEVRCHDIAPLVQGGVKHFAGISHQLCHVTEIVVFQSIFKLKHKFFVGDS